MYLPKDILDKKYEIITPLGEGGFGYVFLARDLLLPDRFVAIKVLKDEDPTRQDSLVQEMQFLTRLNNPSIVSFYHHFTHANKLHLVMEYCSDGNLRHVAKKYSRMDDNTVIQWGIAIAEVLSFVHSQGIVHHDIKPDNILFASDRKLRIGDFGVANRNIGTLVYMPPEIFMEDYVSGRDPRADIYALGITLIEVLLGRNPLAGLVGKDLLLRKLKHDFVPSEKPRWLQDVLLKATHPTPEMRFQTMTDFQEAMSSKSVPLIIDQNRMVADELAEKADTLIKRKKWRDTSKFIDQALYCCPDSVKALLAAGRYRIRVNRFKEGKEFLDRALRLNPRVEVQKELGWINLDQGNYPQALSMLTDYLHRNSSDYEAINLLIQCYYETDRYEQAAELAKAVIGKSPCFRNNYVISQMLTGALPIAECAHLKTEENPFLRYNALVATEEPRAWGPEGPINLKSKMLFQDFRFSSKRSERNTLSIKDGRNTLEFNENIVTVGRSEGNELVVSHKFVSRRHCAVINFPEDVWIYDLNSTAGTFVDNKRVTRKQFLLGVHDVKLGDFEIQIASSCDLLV
jgi:tetratricopeptide (TPR) repeat protein